MTTESLIARLQRDRGDYRKIADATGIKYTTLTKIAAGKTKLPYGRTIAALERYYARQTA